MIDPVDAMLTLVLLSVLLSFSASRLLTLIQVLALQGLAVSVVPLLLGHVTTAGAIILTLGALLVRGVVIPGSIYLAVRRVAYRREVSPIVGYHLSMFAGLLLLVGAIYAGRHIELPLPTAHALLLPTAISLLGGGMFLLMARRNAIAMVLGYIMLENAIYLAGTTFSVRAHHIVEFGILLDVLAGVMIMAIILRSIRDKHDDLDATLLRSLKD
ncbi:MAG: hydrogenase [Pseudomonadota bacterium]